VAIEGSVPVSQLGDAAAAATVGPDVGAPGAIATGGRSTAMWLLPIAAFVEAFITILVMSSIGLIPPLVIFLVILVALGALAIARPRPRVFVAGGIVLLAFVGMNLPFAVDGLIHPTGSSHAWTDIIAIVAGGAGAIAGFAAFIETRTRKPVVRAMRGPIGETLLVLTVGALLGTTYVSALGFRALDGTAGLGVANGVVKAPTQIPVELDASGTTFMQKSLQLRRGPGTIYVVNTDATPHTFDIDLNGRHLLYPLRAGSTTAVVLDLSTAGSYTYWCSIPGHRAMMEGTLVVNGS
jgi:plastocyanin